MSTRVREILHAQMSANDPNKGDFSSEKTIEREQIENTPFWICGHKDHGYFLTFGKFRLTEPKTTIEEVKTEMKEQLYNIVARMMMSLIEDKETNQPIQGSYPIQTDEFNVPEQLSL